MATPSKVKRTAYRRRNEAAAPRLRTSYMLETNGGGRLESVPGFNTVKALAAGFDGGRVPPHLRDPRLGVSADIGLARAQFTFGVDDRALIADTTQLPWRCVCQLVVEGQTGRRIMGTGWLAGPRTVFTAGHNLLSEAHRHQASTIWVLPARAGDAVPYGYAATSSFAVHPLWQATADRERDIGVVWLDEPIGERIGWFGFAAHDDTALTHLLVNNAGYPADKPLGTQWFNAGRILDVGAKTVTYGLDTEPGQSGSPVFYLDTQQRRIVVAVHAYGDAADNIGVRITTDLYDELQAWIR